MIRNDSCPLARSSLRVFLALLAAGAMGLAGAQEGAAFGPQAVRPAEGPAFGPSTGRPPERSISEWLVRMHEASRQRSYVGTFVVSSNVGAMSTARIWHACEGSAQIERIETLTGAPRSTFRRNDEVVTFLPEHRVVRTEKREPAGAFPGLVQSGEGSIPEFYVARRLGQDRVAGFDADVVQLAPKDNLRFGYRIWSEKKSGLMIKLQAIDTDGNVLEQTAFSELQLDAPLKIDKIAAQMTAAPGGWRVEKTEPAKATNAADEGWALKSAVAGFKPVNCYRRPPVAGAPAQGNMQWVFSDGLASVSLFVESYDKQRHVQEGLYAAGATHTLTRRIQDWWLTAVGEVPPKTLAAFAQSLERRK